MLRRFLVETLIQSDYFNDKQVITVIWIKRILSNFVCYIDVAELNLSLIHI